MTGQESFNLQIPVFPKKLGERIECMSKEENRTRNGQIITLLWEAVDRYDNDPSRQKD